MEFYRGKFTRNEPGSFWRLTIVAVFILSLLVMFSLWFFGWGHEPLEPVHDEEPHAAVLRIFDESV